MQGAFPTSQHNKILKTQFKILADNLTFIQRRYTFVYQQTYEKILKNTNH